MKSCLMATAMLIVTTVALALVFNLSFSTAQAPFVNHQSLRKSVDILFVRYLSKNDSIPAESIKTIPLGALSGPIKESIQNGETLDRFSAETVLFKPEWQFLDSSSWIIDSSDVTNLAENVDWTQVASPAKVYSKSPNFETLKSLVKNMPTETWGPLADLLIFVYDDAELNKQEMFEFEPKLVLLQPSPKFATQDSLLSISENLSEESWKGVPNCHLRQWYGASPADYSVDELLTTPELRPLLLGVNDDKLSQWMEDWSQDKHDILTANLPKASKYLSPSQVQILSAPILNGDVTSYQKSVFNMLDMTQLDGLDWADVLANVTMPMKCHLLAIAKNSGVDFSNLNNATDSSALFLFPALQLQSAVDSGNLVVTPEVLQAAKSAQLSRGQAMILVTETFKSVNQKTGEERSQALSQIPQEYLFAMPFMIVLQLSQSPEVKDVFDWRANFVSNYDRLLPSQRLAIAWTTKDDELMSTVSPKMFKASSNNPLKTLKLSGDDFCSTKMDDPLMSNKMAQFNMLYKEVNRNPKEIVPLPLELRKCVVEKYQKYLETKAQIYQAERPPSLDEAYFGGIFWTGSRSFVEGKTGYDPKVLSKMAQGLGSYSLPELLAVATIDDLVSLVTSVTNAMREQRGYKLFDPKLTYPELATLGNLALFAGDQFDQAENFGMYVTGLNDFRGRCVCLPDQLRIPLAKALVKHFGSPEEWSVSDLLLMGDMIALLDHISIGQINKDSLRRAAPHLIQNSCFQLKYVSFPGRLDQPTFEEGCLASQYKGKSIAEAASGRSIEAFKRALFEATLRNIELALQTKDSQELPVTGTTTETTTTEATTTEATTTPKSMTQHDFSLHIIGRVLRAYSAGELSLGQTNKFAFLVEQMSNTTQAKIAEILKVPVNEVPKRTQQLGEFIRGRRESMSPLELQSLRRETDEIRDQYARDLIAAFSWSENDVELDRTTFCKYYSDCEATTTTTTTEASSIGQNVTFDPNFELARSFDQGSFDLGRSFAEYVPKSFCLAVESAGFAASSIGLEDLPSESGEIYECLEILAERWNRSDRLGFWNMIKERVSSRIFNSEGRLQSGAVTMLMPILDVIEADSFSENTELMIDPFSYLGAMPGLSDKAVKAYAGKYSEVRQLATLMSKDGKVGAEALEVAAIGNLVCGLPKGMVEDLVEKSDSQFNMLHLLGATVTSCQDGKILKAVAKKVNEEPSDDWSRSDVAQFLRYGVFLAGVDPSKMAEWPLAIFRAFTPEITSHLTLKHLAALSPDQIGAIPVDAMAVFNAVDVTTGGPVLSSAQFEALTDKRDSVVPMTWLDKVTVGVSRAIDESDKNGLEEEGGKPEPEVSPEPEVVDVKDPKSEPEAEPEGEPTTALSDGGVSKSQLIAIIVAACFLALVLICAAVCCFKKKCCCQKEPEA